MGGRTKIRQYENLEDLATKLNYIKIMYERIRKQEFDASLKRIPNGFDLLGIRQYATAPEVKLAWQNIQENIVAQLSESQKLEYAESMLMLDAAQQRLADSNARIQLLSGNIAYQDYANPIYTGQATQEQHYELTSSRLFVDQLLYAQNDYKTKANKNLLFKVSKSRVTVMNDTAKMLQAIQNQDDFTVAEQIKMMHGCVLASKDKVRQLRTNKDWLSMFYKDRGEGRLDAQYSKWLQKVEEVAGIHGIDLTGSKEYCKANESRLLIDNPRVVTGKP